MNSTLISQPFKPRVLQGSLKNSLAEFALDELLQLTSLHKLIVLRGFSAMEREELLTYCQSQAKLLSWDFGPVMEMKVNKEAKNYLFTDSDVPLHWDGAFYQEPRFLFFHCIEAPLAKAGGETLFVNTEMVWKKAEAAQQKRWQNYQLQFSTEKLAHYGGQISRTLVNQHPDSCATILRFAEPVGEDYLNPVQVHVINQTAEQSELILTELSRAMRDAELCYSHPWQKGDYLLADNFSLLHGRNAFKQHSPRHLRRIQIL